MLLNTELNIKNTNLLEKQKTHLKQMSKISEKLQKLEKYYLR